MCFFITSPITTSQTQTLTTPQIYPVTLVWVPSTLEVYINLLKISSASTSECYSHIDLLIIIV